MKNVILNNIGFKLLALFLAVVTWFYIVVELRKGTVEEMEALRGILPYSMVSLQVPIELDLRGEPHKDYIVDLNNIDIAPSKCILVGPKSLFGKVEAVKTQPVNISGLTKTFTRDVSITPVKGVTMKQKFVRITVPLKKVGE